MSVLHSSRNEPMIIPD